MAVCTVPLRKISSSAVCGLVTYGNNNSVSIAKSKRIFSSGWVSGDATSDCYRCKHILKCCLQKCYLQVRHREHRRRHTVVGDIHSRKRRVVPARMQFLGHFRLCGNTAVIQHSSRIKTGFCPDPKEQELLSTVPEGSDLTQMVSDVPVSIFAATMIGAGPSTWTQCTMATMSTTWPSGKADRPAIL